MLWKIDYDFDELVQAPCPREGVKYDGHAVWQFVEASPTRCHAACKLAVACRFASYNKINQVDPAHFIFASLHLMMTSQICTLLNGDDLFPSHEKHEEYVSWEKYCFDGECRLAEPILS